MGRIISGGRQGTFGAVNGGQIHLCKFPGFFVFWGALIERMVGPSSFLQHPTPSVPTPALWTWRVGWCPRSLFPRGREGSLRGGSGCPISGGFLSFQAEILEFMQVQPMLGVAEERCGVVKVVCAPQACGLHNRPV